MHLACILEFLLHLEIFERNPLAIFCHERLRERRHDMSIRADEIVDLHVMRLHRTQDLGLLFAVFAPRHNLIADLDMLDALLRTIRHLD